MCLIGWYVFLSGFISDFQWNFLCYLFLFIQYLLHHLCYLKLCCLYFWCFHLCHLWFTLSLQSTHIFIHCMYGLHITVYTVFVCCIFVVYDHFIRVINLIFLIIILFICYLVVVFVDFFVLYNRLLVCHQLFVFVIINFYHPCSLHHILHLVPVGHFGCHNFVLCVIHRFICYLWLSPVTIQKWVVFQAVAVASPSMMSTLRIVWRRCLLVTLHIDIHVYASHCVRTWNISPYVE